MAGLFSAELKGMDGALRTLSSITGNSLTKRVDAELRIIAEGAARMMRDRARSTQAPSQLTLLIRNELRANTSREPLLETGTLIRNIVAQRLRPGVFFIGVPSGRRSGRRSKLQLHQIAKMNEEGAILIFRVTESFQKFLASIRKQKRERGEKFVRRGIRSSDASPKTAIGKVFTITIPPRPFIFPVAEVIAKQVVPRVVERLSIALSGTIGKEVQ